MKFLIDLTDVFYDIFFLVNFHPVYSHIFLRAHKRNFMSQEKQIKVSSKGIRSASSYCSPGLALVSFMHYSPTTKNNGVLSNFSQDT